MMLRFFTMLKRGDIELLDGATRDTPEARTAQRRLAREVTEQVHGRDALAAAEEVSALLFGKLDPKALTIDALLALEKEIPTFHLESLSSCDVFSVIDAVSTGKQALFKSKSEARRALQQGGLYLNGERVAENQSISGAEWLHGKYLLVRKGARTYGLVVARTRLF
jgi:tyrosyl-tRNA synthetase